MMKKMMKKKRPAASHCERARCCIEDRQGRSDLNARAISALRPLTKKRERCDSTDSIIVHWSWNSAREREKEKAEKEACEPGMVGGLIMFF